MKKLVANYNNETEISVQMNKIQMKCLADEGFVFAFFSCLGFRMWCNEEQDSQQTKPNQRMRVKTNQKEKKEVAQIITCCEEAKLTVLGTSYAIWVDTPPMSRIPTVLLRKMASLFSLPGMCTSTIASSSAQNHKRPMRNTAKLGLKLTFSF